MKYPVSFQTTLHISCYLFRILAILIWMLGILLSSFYINNALHEKENLIKTELSNNYGRIQWFFRHSAEVVNELKYILENHLNNSYKPAEQLPENVILPRFEPLIKGVDCTVGNSQWRGLLNSFTGFINYWKDNFSTAFDLNRVFFIGGDSQCMADFSISAENIGNKQNLKLLKERLLSYQNSVADKFDNTPYWITPRGLSVVGNYGMAVPIYISGKSKALLGTEQTLRLDEFLSTESIPFVITLIDGNNRVLLSSQPNITDLALDRIPDNQSWFGYLNNYRQVAWKRPLYPAGLSIVYNVSTRVLFEQLKFLIFNIIILNVISGVILFSLVWLFERRIFAPALRNAGQLEEHEQFNRKIISSAPVGICILRIRDGVNILSNELAHNYLNQLSRTDKNQLNEIITSRRLNFVDVMTTNNTNLQISFVHSRYCNENVAICVLIDVSARIKMEHSLQQVARAAEQANQSKSMFLATVSHELRTPLYGIIGNLELLKMRELTGEVHNLIVAMYGSSSMLLKIINDILDFSKIESEQLKIESRELMPRKVINHIISNFLPLIVRHHLTLYCFIENSVPLKVKGDPLRLQQILSNLMNNALKFTHSGCIILHVCAEQGYLKFKVRDTGAGISREEIAHLFEPFFQAGTNFQRNFQGTGLGLAICEKLVYMMDGDIDIKSEPGIGSQFIIRIPIYAAEYERTLKDINLYGKRIWLKVCNSYLAEFLLYSLQERGMQVDYYAKHVGVEDVVLTDHSWDAEQVVKGVVMFDKYHVDVPKEVIPGRWILSTAMIYEVPRLINWIYYGKNKHTEIKAAIPPTSSLDNNSEIMILVVDDHPLNRMLLTQQLKTLGYRTVTAVDGLDALEVMKKSKIDIVLTDVNMPNLNGCGLTQRLREENCLIPIIGVTANTLAEDRQQCINAGMNDCLSKPITLDALNHCINTTFAV